MARAASAGMMEGQSLAGAPASADGYSQSPQPQSGGSDDINVSGLSDQELVDTYQRAASAKGEIENAHEMLAREIEQRRQQAIHKKESSTAQAQDSRDTHVSPQEYDSPAPPSAYRHVENEFDPFDVGPEYTVD